jgi:lysophospholipase L1-like esterase
LELTGTNPTAYVATLYDITSDQLIKQYTDTNNLAELQFAGHAGVFNQLNNDVFFDNFSYSTTDEINTDSAFTPDKTNVKVGQPITYTVTGAGQVTFSDNGAGGAFSPTSVDLGAGSTAEVTYTPSGLGTAHLTATFSDGDIESNIFANPYSTAIGFIGASTTRGSQSSDWRTKSGAANMAKTLGSGYTAVNMGIGSQTTATWANDACTVNQSGSPGVNTCFTNAKNTFQSNGVEIVQIVLGINDAVVPISKEDYKANMQSIIAELKDIGIKKVIVAEVHLSSRSGYPNFPNYISDYNEVLRELVDGETVFLGDTSARAYFAAHPEQFADALHPNDAGYVAMGEMWADAYERVIIEPLATQHGFTGTDEHQVDSDATLTYSIDKDITWFDSGYFAGVLVDNEIVDPDNYTATSGSTIITLAPEYLDTLDEGSHTLAVRFTDGVNFSSTFTILAATTGGGNNNGNSGNNSNNSNGSGSLDAPNTGLFGLSDGATALSSGAVVLATALAAVLLGRKLLRDAK